MTVPRRQLYPNMPPHLRVVREPSFRPSELPKIRTAQDAVAILRPLMAGEIVEVVYALLLDSQLHVLGKVLVGRGVVNSCLIQPREVFHLAVAYMATSVIVAHNHPSGDPSPSAEDRAVTRALVAAGRVLELPVNDHIILGDGDRYCSLSEAGMMS